MASSSTLDTTTFTLYKVPLSVVIKWPPPNYINPARQRWFMVYTVVAHAASTIVVATRIWTRFRKRSGGFGADDVLIIAAWVFAGVESGVGIYGIESIAMDRHVWDMQPPDLVATGLVAWILEATFLFSLSCTKISVLLFFRRLVEGSYGQELRICIWAAIGFTIAYFFSFMFFLIFACSPVEASWKSLNIGWGVDYHCVDRKSVDPLVGALSVFSDLYTMVIPVYIVGRLKLPMSRKIMLYVIFCCGLVVVGAGTMRTIYLARLHTDPLRDLTRVGLKAMFWGSLEMELAIICASAPAVKGFLSSIHERVTTTYGSKKSGSRSRDIEAAKAPDTSGDSAPTDSELGELYDGLHISSRWDEHTSVTSEEMLTIPEKRLKLEGGVLITESVNVNGHNDYDEERRRLGI